MKLNVKESVAPVFTNEGAKAANINAEQQLRRSVMACMLWEDSFYESGEEIGSRIASLVAQCRPEFVAACAAHARGDMKLRHAPLLLVREMARLPKHKALVAKLLADVIMRPDEITEFLAIYWKDKRQPLSAQVKKGLGAAFRKFDEYALAKYDHEGKVRLRDALFLSHSKPRGVNGQRYTKEERKQADQYELSDSERMYKRLIDGELKTPDTWEVALSAGADKKATFERLMAEKKLGALAFLRNLRNMTGAGVATETISAYAQGLNVEKVLPFRFIAAARVCPQLEPVFEPLMLKCMEGQDKLSGRTVLLVDVSGSMDERISAKSDLHRLDAACGLAILLREVCQEVIVCTFSNGLAQLPPRRGFALRDAIVTSQPHSGTYLANTLQAIHANPQNVYDRIIVITDEQTHDGIINPRGTGYVINVASNKNGVGYGAWTHIDGWSEAIVDYLRTYEAN